MAKSQKSKVNKRNTDYEQGLSIFPKPSNTCAPNQAFGDKIRKLFWLFPLFFLLFTGCGYKIQTRSGVPFPSISIEQITNMTYEPKIADRMMIILTEELIKKGFVVTDTSNYKILGSINSIELRTLSEKAGVAIEYEVVIRGDFKLKTPSGMVRDLRSEAPFIVSFLSAERLQDVIALKEKAIDRALKDLSNELIISIIYEH